MFLMLVHLIGRWGIYKGGYGHSLDDLPPEHAAEMKKRIDDYRQEMIDNGGFLPSLWKEMRSK